jgi:hypothetical protein
LPDDEYSAPEQRAQRYRQYALDTARQAMEASSPGVRTHLLALAQHWSKLSESVEEQMERKQ